MKASSEKKLSKRLEKKHLYYLKDYLKYNRFGNERKNPLPKIQIELIKKISFFPQAIISAANSLNSTILANYSYELAQIFNEFYHECPVIGSNEKEIFRLKLVKSFKQVLKNSLFLLGIETLEEM